MLTLYIIIRSVPLNAYTTHHTSIASAAAGVSLLANTHSFYARARVANNRHPTERLRAHR